MTETVLVTGATGYLASHVVKVFQEAGYKVRGTVRSLKDPDKLNWLKNLCPDAKHPLELVEANLLDPGSWKDAVKGCTYVMHVASPFPMGHVENEDDVIKPAVEGTKNVLQKCAEAGTVRKVVLTSSVVAVHGEDEIEPGKAYTEEDWTNCESKTVGAYSKSKTLAEKAAWDFVKNLEGSEKFELSVINPMLILGPVLNVTSGTSVEVMKRFMENQMTALPQVGLVICDVRDVALAHLRAMTIPEAANHRHLIYSANMWLKEVADILAKEFRPQGYTIPTMHCPYFVLWLASFFNKTAKSYLSRVGRQLKIDNTRMRTVLKIEPRDVSSTLNDMVYSLIDHGIIKKTDKYRGKKVEIKAEE
uniref:Cinnamoyl-CoA reductase 1 n=1 Tax=Scolopendra viridis TaxID=118503 RepID=A0A4D5R9U3_SCOVI